MLETEPLDGKERQELEDLRKFKKIMLNRLPELVKRFEQAEENITEARLRIREL
ncbi:hypothetical protein HYW46_00690 [Candidatus Daviesbacteria bacterium]|nr:hypothetical protein [Candidatus Daviesbacteria bacterium]